MTDVAVVGSGPNGLAAAVVLARAGLEVQVYEAAETIGGGARTLELTEPGYRHDWGSAVHPMAVASGFFRRFGLTDRIPFATPEVSYAQGLDNGRAGLAWRDLERTADGLGRDGDAWRATFEPLVREIDVVVDAAMSPPLAMLRRPFAAARLGMRVGRNGTFLAPSAFRGGLAPALLAGVMAHSIARLPSLGSAAVGVVLTAMAHAGGWPIPIGGSQSITDALVRDLTDHGGSIETGRTITSLAEIPAVRAVLFDTSASQLHRIAGERLEPSYARALESFRYGNAASKVDFVLSEAVPWANEDIQRTGTVHLGGTYAEIAAGEAEVAAGRYPRSPYVLVSQPGAVDVSRVPADAPAGTQTLWAYTHVPRGSDRDMTEAITAQVERFAPGFRDVVVASRATPAAAIERGNPNFIGGDIGSGAASIRQLLARPVLSTRPWRAAPGLYLCSAAATPGPGVHGMAGYQAARLALREVFGMPEPSLAP